MIASDLEAPEATADQLAEVFPTLSDAMHRNMGVATRRKTQRSLFRCAWTKTWSLVQGNRAKLVDIEQALTTL